MSFWRRIWGIFNADNDVNWSETVKGGVEVSEKIFALAEAVNKKENKEFLKSILKPTSVTPTSVSPTSVTPTSVTPTSVTPTSVTPT